MGAQVVRWDKGGSRLADDYTFIQCNGHTNNQMGRRLLVH